MRAREPDESGYAVNDGVRIYYEVFGTGTDTIVLMPPHQIIHSRIWRMQVPFLSRHFRVVLYDGRGNGRSDRPPSGYTLEDLVADGIAVMDELDLTRCALVAEGSFSRPAVRLAIRYSDRVVALVLLAPRFSGTPRMTLGDWEEWKRRYVAEYSANVRDQAAHLVFPEPHSTKQRDDFYDWAHETDPRIILAAMEECWIDTDARPLLPEVSCPVLLIHGRQDQCVLYEQSVEGMALLPDAQLVTIGTPGGFPAGRDPVRINLLVREFLARHLSLRPSREAARIAG